MLRRTSTGLPRRPRPVSSGEACVARGGRGEPRRPCDAEAKMTMTLRMEVLALIAAFGFVGAVLFGVF
jgi:hypothetical protein